MTAVDGVHTPKSNGGEGGKSGVLACVSLFCFLSCFLAFLLPLLFSVIDLDTDLVVFAMAFWGEKASAFSLTPFFAWLLRLQAGCGFFLG